jgi:hypothetical protein
MAEVVGFPWLMRLVGLSNLIYSPLCCLLRHQDATIPLLAPTPGSHHRQERVHTPNTLHFFCLNTAFLEVNHQLRIEIQKINVK